MRLAAKRRQSWSGLGDFDGDLAGRVERGLGEVVRFGEGDPLVLLPGLAGSWRLLRPLARALASRFEVILPAWPDDRGLPATGSEPTIGGYAEFIARLLDRLRLERPTVVGVSFGAAVALELAVQAPGRVGALVVSGVEARFRNRLGAKVARRVLERYPLPRDSGFINQFFQLLHGGRLEPGPLAEFLAERIWDTDQGVMAARLRALEAFDVSDRLWRIEAPALVLGGTRDAIVAASRQKSLAESIPGACFESLEGAGHVGFLTHRADFVRGVVRFARARRRAFADRC